MINDQLIAEALLHAEESIPMESCGLLVRNLLGNINYVRCTNVSAVTDTFIMNPLDYAKAEDSGEIVMIVHSHYGKHPDPSDADLVGCYSSNLPWLIVSYPLGTYKVIQPNKTIIPLKGREYIYGVFDCFSIARDYYMEKFGIVINNYYREPNWWLNGKNMYIDHYKEEGFIEVDISDLREHDAIIMQVRSPVPNHIAIYTGNTKILHHLQDRLSCEDMYSSYWRKNTVLVIRHKDLV